MTSEDFELGSKSPVEASGQVQQIEFGAKPMCKLIEGMLTTDRLPPGEDHNPTVIFWPDAGLASIKPRLTPNSVMLCQKSHKTNYDFETNFSYVCCNMRSIAVKLL